MLAIVCLGRRLFQQDTGEGRIKIDEPQHVGVAVGVSGGGSGGGAAVVVGVVS